MNKCDRRRFDDFAKDAALRFTAAFSFVSLDDSSSRRLSLLLFQLFCSIFVILYLVCQLPMIRCCDNYKTPRKTCWLELALLRLPAASVRCGSYHVSNSSFVAVNLLFFFSFSSTTQHFVFVATIAARQTIGHRRLHFEMLKIAAARGAWLLLAVCVCVCECCACVHGVCSMMLNLYDYTFCSTNDVMYEIYRWMYARKLERACANLTIATHSTHSTNTQTYYTLTASLLNGAKTTTTTTSSFPNKIYSQPSNYLRNQHENVFVNFTSSSQSMTYITKIWFSSTKTFWDVCCRCFCLFLLVTNWSRENRTVAEQWLFSRACER